MMFFWVLVSPGSCVASAFPESGAGAFSRIRRRHERDVVQGVARVVPPSLIAKYRAHPAVCLSHVLPSALWSALVPTQLHGGFRRRFPRAHRVAGRVVVVVVVAMTAGYVAIHRRRLHFHANDFPSLADGDAMSLVAPGAWRAIGRAVRAIAGTRPGDSSGSVSDSDSDFARDGFAAFEHAAAAWFAWTAVATVWIAVRRNGAMWIDAHRAWATRHVGAGLSVAAQRAALLVAHGACRAVAGAADACQSPRTQKAIFADALAFGAAACVGAAEVAVRDARRIDRAKKTR